MNLRKTEVKFMGHLITKDGLKPDPDKIKDVENMPKPTSKQYLLSLLGFINYLAKFMPKLAHISRGGSRPSQHSQLRMSDFLVSRFSNLTNLSAQIESDFSRLLTPVPTDICCTLGIPQGSGNLAIVIK